MLLAIDPLLNGLIYNVSMSFRFFDSIVERRCKTLITTIAKSTFLIILVKNGNIYITLMSFEYTKINTSKHFLNYLGPSNVNAMSLYLE